MVNRWAPGVWQTIEGRLRDGEVTLLEAMDEEFRHVRATEAEVIAYVVAEAGIRPGFAEFVRWLAERGDRLIVVSAGFRVLIDPILQKAGLGDLHVHAGDALFSPAGTILSYPPSSKECVSGCGHCKSETIAAHGPFAGPVVYLGDGYSDRCAAGEADIVFARGGLAEYLDRAGRRLPSLRGLLRGAAGAARRSRVGREAIPSAAPAPGRARPAARRSGWRSGPRPCARCRPPPTG